MCVCVHAQTRRSAPMGGRVRGVGAAICGRRHGAYGPRTRSDEGLHLSVEPTERPCLGALVRRCQMGSCCKSIAASRQLGRCTFCNPPPGSPLPILPPHPAIPPLPRLRFRWSPTPLARGASSPVRNRSLAPSLGLIRRAPSVTFLAGGPKKVVILSKGSCHLAQRGRG